MQQSPQLAQQSAQLETHASQPAKHTKQFSAAHTEPNGPKPMSYGWQQQQQQQSLEGCRLRFRSSTRGLYGAWLTM